jgi:hypothetical protein
MITGSAADQTMLKLLSIVLGLALTLWGAVLLNVWLFFPGLVLLALGLFFFGWDFGSAQSRPMTAEKEAPEPPAAPDRPRD